MTRRLATIAATAALALTLTTPISAGAAAPPYCGLPGSQYYYTGEVPSFLHKATRGANNPYAAYYHIYHIYNGQSTYQGSGWCFK